ncbi:triacylglycerol lipase [Dorcoceras hygrometricum]|uniref:Triacylglycerol lipase n=1 Tax=Dorcoceras hygrometricum TaxID=472368 RepID=A0A2Z7CZ29_9LAMI|nr:triacylglycerol lipase [Dorcoceras hygrometricum]
MASALINKTVQVYRASVLAMDHEGMVSMFEALVASGLSGFLGCSSALFEAALVEFLHNASVRDGIVVSTVQGKPVAISEELFASTFELPMEGLTDLHEVSQDLILEARRAFSYSGKLISTSCKKREMVSEFRLLNDILAKSITVKAGSFDAVTHESTCVTLNGSGIQLSVGPQPLWLRNHNSGLSHRIMVKRLATSSHDPLGITDSACKNQLVVVSVQYGPFNPYIPIRSTTIGKSRVAIDPIAMRTSWRSNSDIASVTRTNQYNQDLGLINSTNGNHLESPKEGSSIDHQVTIYLHAQNITMFTTNETWYFASQILVSNSGSLILILTAQSTRNMFRIHSDY